MAINPAWTDADTVAFKSLALEYAETAIALKAKGDAILRILNDNDLTFEALGDDATVGGPVLKQAIWDVLGFDAQLGRLWSNQQLDSLGFWGGVLGRIVKV